MNNAFNNPHALQFDEMNRILHSMSTSLSTLAKEPLIPGPPFVVDSLADLQTIVRRGLGKTVFRVGDVIKAKFEGAEKLWDVIGIDHDTPTDRQYTHSLTLMSRDILLSGVVSATQGLIGTDDGIAAGTHCFSIGSTQYTFTITKAIPAGGILYVSSWLTTATTYEADRKTAIETGITIVTTSGQVDTITADDINTSDRARYGSNNWVEGGVRQWLNSDAVAWVWQPQTKWDRPSSYKSSGFLKLLDPELAAIIGAVDKQVARNSVNEGGGQDLFSDKVFLLSRVEMGYGSEGDISGELVYPFWDGVDNSARVKGSPSAWWLRSPLVGSSYYVRNVYTDGSLSVSNAGYSQGLVPACVII